MKAIGTIFAIMVCNAMAIDVYHELITTIEPTVGVAYYHTLFSLIMITLSGYGIWKVMQ